MTSPSNGNNRVAKAMREIAAKHARSFVLEAKTSAYASLTDTIEEAIKDGVKTICNMIFEDDDVNRSQDEGTRS